MKNELDRQGLAEPVGTFPGHTQLRIPREGAYKTGNLTRSPAIESVMKLHNLYFPSFVKNDLQCAAVSKRSKTSLTRLIPDHQTLLQSAQLDTDDILLPKTYVIRSGAPTLPVSRCQSPIPSFIYELAK